MSARGAAGRASSSDALLLGRIPYGESDLIVRLFTARDGKLAALARGARKSGKRFAGALEPLHTLHVSYEQRAGRELATLRDSTLARPRLVLSGALDRMDAAGTALRWLAHTLPERTPEPRVWQLTLWLLDRLDGAVLPAESTPRSLLASFGLQVLRALGWGLELGCCVRCGKPCAPGRAARLHPALGGLVCSGCGAAPILVGGAARQRLMEATETGLLAAPPDEIEVALRITEETLRAHTGLA